MKLGFIGTGNMASAIMGGVIKKNIFPAEEIIGADLFAPGRERVKEQFGINVTDSNKEVIEKAEVVILSVKPQFYADVIAEIKDIVKPEQLIITIAPGKTLTWLADQFEDHTYNAEYTGYGWRRYDSSMPERAYDGRRDCICEDNSGKLQQSRSCTGEIDGCSNSSQRKLTGICIYDD